LVRERVELPLQGDSALSSFPTQGDAIGLEKTAPSGRLITQS